MPEQIIFLIVGLIGLWVGADFLIRGAKNIAKHFNISEFIIGLALVSIGTSIPEISVSVAGALDRLAGTETSGIVIGNTIGSALSQISLLMGILAFFVPLRLNRKDIFKQGSFLIASVLLIFVLAVDGHFSRLDGLILVLAYLGYYIYLWRDVPIHKPGRRSIVHLIKDIIYIAVGLTLVLLASDVVVDNGISLANHFGVRQSLVGILLIGIGTGLPELSVAVAGFRRKAIKISMGNLIGSNICDLLFSLGAGTVISGFLVESVNLYFDLPVLLFFSFTVLALLYTRRRISKLEGSVLLLLFTIYAVLKLLFIG